MKSAGSLSLRPEGEGADVRRLFCDQPTSGTRVLSGTVVHVAAIALLLFLARLVPDKVYESVLPQRLPERLVWLVQPGPGGGGGGNKSPEPPPPAELKGQQQISVPAATPPLQPTEPEKVTDPPIESLTIPAQPLAAATEVTFGDITSRSASTANARGGGDGPGVGSSDGPGAGRDGKGGLGDDGPFQAGNGVLPPRIRRKVDPQYSADAMRAKIQGAVRLSGVVLPDGSLTDIRVIRSLDRSFGLDSKAIEAARQWLFFPGTRQGQPVPVLVNIELEFNLR